MIDSESFEMLLAAVKAGADATRLDALMRQKDLARVFPALGIPPSVGLTALYAAAQRRRPDPEDPVGREIFDYLGGLMSLGAGFDSLAEELRRDESGLVAQAWARASEFLPPVPPPANLLLVFLPLGLDFRTDRETVYMDPWTATSLGLKGVRVTLAHEFHHVGRYLVTGENLNIMDPLPPGHLKDVRSVFRNWASWLETEGIADCVSSVTETDVPVLHGIVEVRRRQMEGYGELLRGCLSQLASAEANPSIQAEDLEKLRSGLRDLAHPIGARMAKFIEAEQGRPALRSCVGRPAEFLQRYDAIVRERGEPEFGPHYLAWLD